MSKEMTPAQRESVEAERAAAYDEMGAWLFKNYSTALRDQNYCLEHMRPCGIDFGSDDGDDDDARISLAGLTCVGWSIMGKATGTTP